MTIERLIDLRGAVNFRDLGGYETRDGRCVRWRTLFRSGSLATLDDDDVETVHALGIATIVDLRSTRERDNQPSRLHVDGRSRQLAHPYESSGADLLAYLASDAATADTAHHRMTDLYRALPYEQSAGYRMLFEQLATGPLPLLFHCAAGKDRTGVGAALLLDALDVPRQVISEDYVITDEYFERNCATIVAGDHHLATIGRDLLEPVMRARTDYLDAMFETIDARHGSVGAYVHDVLGLAGDTILTLRNRLLD